MRDVTIVFPIKDNKIFLGRKKRGFGANKINGFGGKFRDEDGTILRTAIRELWEEAGIIARESDLEKVAEIEFYFPSSKEKEWNQRAHVYFVYEWNGIPSESEEMTIEKYSFNEIPFGDMWDTDQHWMPLLINGKKVKGAFYFNDDCNTTKEYNLEEVNSL